MTMPPEDEKMNTGPPPSKRFSILRFFSIVWRHKVATLCGSGIAFIWLAFAQNLINAEIACSINFGQPNVSDACGYFGLGDKPTREERVDWGVVEARLVTPTNDNCTALQNHIRRYPDGAFAAEADRLVRNPFEYQTVTWVPENRTLPLFEEMSEAGFATAAEAETEVFERATAKARQQCDGFTSGDIYRVLSSSISDHGISCDQSSNLHYCTLEGTTVCSLERRLITIDLMCGTQKP